MRTENPILVCSVEHLDFDINESFEHIIEMSACTTSFSRKTSTLSVLSVASVITVAAHVFIKQIQKYRVREKLASLAREAVRKRDEKVHVCLSTSISVTDVHHFYTACDIVSRIKQGDLSARKLVLFLAKRCVTYGRRNVTNSITEEFYDEAYTNAELIDNYVELKSNGEEIENRCLLLGVPISVKDCIGLKGALQTGGMQCRTDEKYRSLEDSLIVRVIRSAGALPMCRGNVSQIMMLPESDNNVWGRSLNPWDLSRTPGGSSGGDGALVAMKCVPLAIGSDIGGSIRIPAIFCGIVGFKPTSNRLSMKGCMKPRKNDRFGLAITLPVVCGPMARTVDDCVLFMKAACTNEMFENDTQIVPLHFRDEIYRSPSVTKLKLGYFMSDGWFEPCSGQKRALRDTIRVLEAAGHHCVPFDIPTDGWSTYTLYASIIGAEGNMRGFTDGIEGESLIPAYGPLFAASNLPNWIRPLIRFFLDKRRSSLLKSMSSGGIQVHEYWQKCADLAELRQKWDDAYKHAKIDAIIHPALPLPAFQHGISGDLTAPFSYTMLANLLTWPSGVVPVSCIREDEQHYNIMDIPADQRDSFALIAAQVMERSKGLPLSIAVLTRGFEDEKCLHVMNVIEKLMKFSSEPTAYIL